MLTSMDISQEQAIEITRLLEESNGKKEKAFGANLRSHLRKLAIRLHLGTPSAVGQSLSRAATEYKCPPPVPGPCGGFVNSTRYAKHDCTSTVPKVGRTSMYMGAWLASNCLLRSARSTPRVAR